MVRCSEIDLTDDASLIKHTRSDRVVAEWVSKLGLELDYPNFCRRHTGRTDIPLTDEGEARVRLIAARLVGPGLAIDPAKIALAIISPRQRARRTFELLFQDAAGSPPITITEDVREWDYGDYEGRITAEIHEAKPTWSIWKDGAPGGESVTEMEARVDGIIRKIRDLHKDYVAEKCNTRDVLIVAHGHFNRVLIARWMKFPLNFGTSFNVEPGSVAVLGYNHNSLEEPALNALNLFATIL